MRQRRWSDNDKHFGPITYSRCESYRPVTAVIDSGAGESPGCHLRVSAFGHTVILEIPQIIKPWRRWVDTSKHSWSTTPNGGYWDEHHKEYGFSLNEGFLQVFLGAQTHDSETTQNWCAFLPWTQWRFVRKSLYDLEGRHFWTEPTGRQVPGGTAWEEQERMREAVPKAVFLFDDYDGKRITATTHIEEWEWKFGEGWFKWLSLFRRPKVRRTLDIQFSDEVGPEKGSWKGGTLGHGIDMLPGELHEAAFRRYCEQEHRSKYRRFHLSFVGAA